MATPGRALQHLEETPGLDAGRLQALVVDEADRVVDLGFAPQLDAIATYLPAAGARRTWLFSATLAGVGGGGARLARLRALADAATVEFVVARDDRAALLRAGAPAAAAAAATAAPTPAALAQRLVVCALEDKLDLLYAFWVPSGSAYNVDGILRVMVAGLDAEIDDRLADARGRSERDEFFADARGLSDYERY